MEKLMRLTPWLGRENCSRYVARQWTEYSLWHNKASVWHAKHALPGMLQASLPASLAEHERLPILLVKIYETRVLQELVVKQPLPAWLLVPVDRAAAAVEVTSCAASQSCKGRRGSLTHLTATADGCRLYASCTG